MPIDGNGEAEFTTIVVRLSVTGSEVQARPGHWFILLQKNWIFFLKALLHTSNDVFQISWKPRLGYCNFFLSIIIFFLKNEKYNFYDGDFLLATIQVLKKKYWKFVLRFLD